jgi:hypothetical protein
MTVMCVTHRTRGCPVVTALQCMTTPQKLITNTRNNWSLQLRVAEHSRRHDREGFKVRQNKRRDRGFAAGM